MFENLPHNPPESEDPVNIRIVPPPPPVPRSPKPPQATPSSQSSVYQSIFSPTEPAAVEVIAPKPKSKRKIWIVVAIVLGVILLGAGGTFAAYKMGYVQLPFLDTVFVPKDVMGSFASDLKGMQSGKADLSFFLVNEERSDGIKPLKAITSATQVISSDVGLTIPKEMAIQGTVSTFVGKSEGGNKPNALFSIQGSYASSGTKLELNAETRLKSGTTYARLNTFPSFGGLELGSVVGRWIDMTNDGSDNSNSSILSMLDFNLYPGGITLQELQRMLPSMTQAMVNEKMIIASKKEKTEKIDNKIFDVYSLSIDSGKLEKTVSAFLKQEKTYCESHADCLLSAYATYTGTDTQAIENGLQKQITASEVRDAFEQIASATKLRLFVGHGDADYMLDADTRFAYPEEIETLKSRQGHLSLRMHWSQFNKTPTVETPRDTLSFSEAERILSGYTEDEWKFLQQEQNLLSLRNALEVYAQSHDNQYPETLVMLLKSNDSNSNINASASRPIKLAQLNVNTIQLVDPLLMIETPSYTPTLKEIPIDLFTDQPFVYSKSAHNFTITFEMRFPEQRQGSKLSSYILGQYVDGKNTLDKYVLSREAESAKDSDNDGLTGAQEVKHDTNPYMRDTDGDSFSDFDELQKNTDPLDADSHPTPEENSASIDVTTGSANGGGIMIVTFPNATNLTAVYVGDRRAYVKEFNTRALTIIIPGTREAVVTNENKIVTVKVVNSGKTIIAGTFTYSGESRKDTDNDKLPDKEELGIGTDIALADTDKDGFSDFIEVESGHNPNDAPPIVHEEETQLDPIDDVAPTMYAQNSAIMSGDEASISFWAKSHDWSLATNRDMVSYYDSDQTQRLLIRKSGEYVSFIVYADTPNSTSGYSAWSASSDAWKNDTWQHIAVTWKIGEVPKLYLDGKLLTDFIGEQSTTVFSTNEKSALTSLGVIYQNGQKTGSAGVTRVEDLAISQAILTSDAIQSVFTRGKQ